jgi:hypothetical protein
MKIAVWPVRNGFVAGLVASCGLAAALAIAQDKPAEAPAAAVDPRALATLKKMGACLAAARQFSFTAEDMLDRVLPDGQRIQYSVSRRFQVRRPDALLADSQGDLVNVLFVYDGKTVAVHDRSGNVYATLPAPETIDKTIDLLATRYSLTMPLSDLFFSDPCVALLPFVRSGMYVGKHPVRGVPCHHLAFRQENVDWQIWIQDGETPLPRKVVITYKELPGDPQFIAFLDNWNLAAPDARFEFTPPAGAQKTELTPGRGVAGAPAESPDATPAARSAP